MISSRRMGWTAHVVHVRAIENIYKILIRKFKGRDHLEDLSLDGSVI
jgi:hypothetical protein